MEFHQYASVLDQARRANSPQWQLAKRHGGDAPWRDFYSAARQEAERPIASRDRLLATECLWYDMRRPYYFVWPAIVSALLRTPLDDFCGEHVSFPVSTLLLQFGRNQEPDLGEEGRFNVKTMLIASIRAKGLRAFVSFSNDARLVTFMMPLPPGVPIERALESVKPGDVMLECEVRSLAKLICGIGLLHDSPELIERDVLAKDREAYKRTGDAKYIDRAIRRRGCVGWHIGKGVQKMIERGQVAVHVRRPHFATRMTGPGRTIPRLVFIPFAIVNKRRAIQMPTGYLDDEAA